MEEGERIETGPIQFGDDWPGVFIRGDEALYWLGILRTIDLNNEPCFTQCAIDDLIKTLASCHAAHCNPERLSLEATMSRARRVDNNQAEIVAALRARVEEIEAENARLQNRIEELEDMLEDCAESLAGDDW